MRAEHWDGVAKFIPPDDPTLLRLALRSLINHSRLRNTLAMRAQRPALGCSALARTEAAACAS
jgi:hypothetical protein